MALVHHCLLIVNFKVFTRICQANTWAYSMADYGGAGRSTEIGRSAGHGVAGVLVGRVGFGEVMSRGGTGVKKRACS